MLKLTLATRITMIVLVSLLAVWVIALGGLYRNRGAAVLEGAQPAPLRIAALATLIERSPPRARALVLGAVRNPQFVPTVHRQGWQEPAASADAPPVDPALAERYRRVLGGREVAISTETRLTPQRWLPRALASSANGLHFRIGLKTGEVLTIDTRRSLLMNQFGLPVGFGAGVLGTVIAVLALLIMQRETRPLARLAAAVDRVELGGDPVKLPDKRSSAPEIRAVTAAFNRLQDRLSGMMRARLALIGGISHDVRSFATRLRLRVEKIPQEDERARAIADIDDMIHLLDDALLSTQAGAGQLSEELIDFAALVRSEVEDQAAQGAPVDLSVKSGSGEVLVLGDRIALRRIVSNLLNNAVLYGGAAHVTVLFERDEAVLVVDDEGGGIPPAQRDLMLEPFSRLEESRNRKTGGAGLGLAVVRALAEAHGGRVAIEDAPEGGGRVSVRLPVFRPGEGV